MSNPILDEITDACISDEMKKKLEDEKQQELDLKNFEKNFNMNQELKELRIYLAKDFDKILNHKKYIQKLGVKYFLDLSSTDIFEKYLPHLGAYEYCMQKAIRDTCPL